MDLSIGLTFNTDTPGTIPHSIQGLVSHAKGIVAIVKN